MKSRKPYVLMCASITSKEHGIYRCMRGTANALEKKEIKCEIFLKGTTYQKLPKFIQRHAEPHILLVKILWKLYCQPGITHVEINASGAFYYALFRKVLKFLPICIVRSHGIETVVFNELSKRIPFSLVTRLTNRVRNWTINMSFKLSDLNVIYNSTEKDFLINTLNAKHTIVSSISVSNQTQCLDVTRAKELLKPRIVFIGTWIDRKVFILKSIVGRLLKRGFSNEFYFIGILKDLEPELNKSFVNSKATFKVLSNYTSLNEVMKATSPFDIFLFPSLIDAGPFVVLEAMLMKLTVICSNKCLLIRDIAKHNEHLKMIDVNNIDEFDQTVIELNSDDLSRKKLATNGHELVLSHTWALATQEYVKYLNSAH